MPSTKIALLSEVPEIDAAALARTAAAIQRQLSDEFAPAWDIEATIHHFLDTKDVPDDYWRLTVTWDVPEGEGVHKDDQGRPTAFVEWVNNWTAIVSHEVMEMLADPDGKRLIDAPSIMNGRDIVSYLVEVCDPCGAANLYYEINGQKVSDFCLPSFYKAGGGEGVRYSQRGSLLAPHDVRPGGYLTWLEPSSRHWWQARWFKGTQTSFHDLGIAPPADSFRAWIDRLTLPMQARCELEFAVEVSSDLEQQCREKADRFRSRAAEVGEHFSRYPRRKRFWPPPDMGRPNI